MFDLLPMYKRTVMQQRIWLYSMNIVLKRDRFKNKYMFAIYNISHNYGVNTTQGKCLFYFISTLSILMYTSNTV